MGNMASALDFRLKGPVLRGFGDFVDDIVNKLLNKQSILWCFETLSFLFDMNKVKWTQTTTKPNKF